MENRVSLSTYVDLYSLVNRVSTEAETTEEMATILNAEIYAYQRFVNVTKPYMVILYEEAKPFGENVIIGEFYKTEDDYDDDEAGYIMPESSMKKGNYYVEYKAVYKMEV